MARAIVASLITALAGAANISDAFLGQWTPVNHSTVHSPMGPSGLFQQFAMSKDASNGDFWMSAIKGQVFRVRDDLMQYCFAHVATSPFVVDSISESKLVFCYETNRRMNTHKATPDGLATGCDAAQIVVELLSNGNLEFTFMMSPPAKHAWAVFERTGSPPAIWTYKLANLGDPCDPKNPGPPTLTEGSPASLAESFSSMCPVAAQRGPQPTVSTAAGDVACRQLDSGSWGLNPTERVDVRLEYTIPTAPCWPCNVSYSVSAAIREDQYVALGFKGMAYRAMLDEVRPGYFGMATDEVDASRTGRVVVLGYAQSASACVREMKVETYVGSPVDVDGNPNIFEESVERVNGRTVIHFTVEQHVGQSDSQIDAFFNTEQVSARVMWAIGDVKAPSPVPTYTCSVCAHVYDASEDGDGVAFEDLPETWTCPVCGQPKSAYQPTEAPNAACREAIQYHSEVRGVSPLAWFDQNPFCAAQTPLAV